MCLAARRVVARFRILACETYASQFAVLVHFRVAALARVRDSRVLANAATRKCTTTQFAVLGSDSWLHVWHSADNDLTIRTR